MPVDYIAGTSMGALIGGLHATGMTPEELHTLVGDIDWKDIFSDNVPRKNRPWRRKTDDDLGLYGAKIGLSKDGAPAPQNCPIGQNQDTGGSFRLLRGRRPIRSGRGCGVGRKGHERVVPQRKAAGNSGGHGGGAMEWRAKLRILRHPSGAAAATLLREYG